MDIINQTKLIIREKYNNSNNSQ